jgi:uncharacterized protein YjdB
MRTIYKISANVAATVVFVAILLSCSKSAEVTSITVTPSELVLQTGEKQTLTASVEPKNAENKAVEWSSSASATVEVDDTGEVTAKTAGVATVTATTSNGKTATCTITVAGIAATGVSLDENTLSLTVGEKATLTATVVPDNAADKTVTWSSSIPAIAFADSQGEVTAMGVGSTVIMATTRNGNKTAACLVTVSPVIRVTDISLNKNTLSLAVGTTETLTATVLPDNAADKTVTWSSSNPSTASVNESTGIITAVAVGTTVISAVAGDKKATCNLTVTNSLTELRVMSFNIWVGGGRSIERTIAAITESGADIVGLQEANNASDIATRLGWTSVQQYGSSAIISRYPIVASSSLKIGAKLKVGENQYVWMFNQHFIYCPYEPYRLNGIEYCGYGTLYTADEAITSAWNARKNEVERTIAEIQKAQKEQIPVFLTGDFNEPSWLDWTERAATAGICKMAVAWPSTRNIQERTEMIDSYRTFYPDEVAKPGYTWTPLPAARDVLDRIDFVFFWGATQLIKSEIVGEKKPESDIVISAYPSDHRAVLSSFYIY